MKYTDYETGQYSAYSEDYPHKFFLRVAFKTKTERTKFLRAVRKLLEE